jgi:hypothetical protein
MGTSVSPWLLASAAPPRRDADDLDALVDCTRTLRFFRDVPVEAAREILALAEFVRVPADCVVGRCRLTVSKPVLTAPMVSALEPKIS